MATKPASLGKWATSANYTVGPKTGTPTKIDASGLRVNGHVPGTSNPMGAQEMNYWQGLASDWIVDWLEQGTSTFASTTHIVETDSYGRINVDGAQLRGNASYISPTFSASDGASTREVALIYRLNPSAHAILKFCGPDTDAYGIYLDTFNFPAIRCDTTGTAAPIELGTRTTTDPSPIVEGSLWATKSTGTVCLRFGAVRSWVKNGLYQYLEGWGQAGTTSVSTTTPTMTTVISGVSLTDLALNVVQCLATVSFIVPIPPGSGITLTVEVRIGATGLASQTIGLNHLLNYAPVSLQMPISVPAGITNNFGVYMCNSASATTQVSNVMLTIRSL